MRAGSAAVPALAMLMPIAGRPPPVPPMKISVPPSRTLLAALRETQSSDSLVDAVPGQLSFPEQVSLILADVLGAQRIG